MQDSIYFFDQFKVEFLKILKDQEQIRQETLIHRRPDFNEICEIRGCLYAIQNIRNVFEMLEARLKEKYQKDGHL